jgi:hypothetical protein
MIPSGLVIVQDFLRVSFGCYCVYILERAFSF